MNDLLGHHITGSRLAAEYLDPRRPVAVGLGADFAPQGNGLEDVEVLALVFVDALDLDVEHRRRIDGDAGFLLHPFRQIALVCCLGLGEGVEERLVADVGLQPGKLLQIVGPALADGLVDEARQARVARQQPAPRRHTVGLVDDALGVKLVQVLEDGPLHQLRVQRRHAVDPVRHDEGQFAHLDAAVVADRHLAARIHAGMVLVDTGDQRHVARQQVGHQAFRPALQRLGQKGVVGVGQATARNVDGGVEIDAALVEQQAHQFRASKRRVGVVQLDCHLLGQHVQIVVLALEAAQHVAQRGRCEEVLLLEAQLLALLGGVVGVEHAADGARQHLRFGGSDIFAAVETLQVKQPRRQRAPKPQGVGPTALPADDRRIVRLRDDALRGLPHRARAMLFHRSAETDLVHRLGALEFPGALAAQPVLRRLDLAAVIEALLEQAVLVADAVAETRAADGRHGVEITGGETAEAAIAERRIGLVGQNLFHRQAEFVEGRLDMLVQTQIGDRVFEEAADEEFHRQVVDALLVAGIGGAGGGEPAVDNEVTHGQRQRHAPVVGLGVAGILAQRIGQMPQHAFPYCRWRHVPRLPIAVSMSRSSRGNRPCG